MGKFKKLTLATAISSAFVLTGCGGSSSSDDGAGSGGSAATETGVFVDAAVAGINYTTSPSGQSGQTNELGEYDYAPGDTVIFSIGGIELPSVEATGRVTPADMGSGGADWSADQTVVNVLRLLQTLDSDGDPSNGITITEALHTALQDIDLDPTVSEADFETQANIAINSTNKALISKADAVNHFQESQSGDLIGSWVYEESNGNVNVLTFINDSEYMIAHSQADDGDQGAASAEYGTYTWDTASGVLTITVGSEFNGDNSGGLSDLGAGPVTMTLDGNTLVFNADEGSFSFDKVSNANDSILGSWYLSEGLNGEAQVERHNVLTILDDSNYVIVHNDNEEVYGSDLVENVSSEWGTYTFDGTTFTVTNVSVETDGPGGLFDNPDIDSGNGYVDGPAELHPTGQLTLSDNAPGGDSFTLRRLGRYAVTLMDFDGDTKQIYVVASGNDFSDSSQAFIYADLDDTTDNPGTFNLTASATEKWTVTLDSNDYSGSMNFEAAGETNVINADGWSVLSSGALQYTEEAGDGSLGKWTYLPIEGNSGATLVYLDGSDVDLLFTTEIFQLPN